MAPLRCFVAAWPSAEVVSALAGLPRPTRPGLRWSGEDQWHVTLRFFGDLGPAEVDEATAALSKLASALPGAFTARGGPATKFLGPGLLIWPVDGLGPAAGPIGQATAHIGQPLADRPFLGHVTVARGAGGADLLSPLSASWPVTSLALVHSRLGAGGARYRDICTFALGPSRDRLPPPASPGRA